MAEDLQATVTEVMEAIEEAKMCALLITNSNPSQANNNKNQGLNHLKVAIEVNNKALVAITEVGATEEALQEVLALSLAAIQKKCPIIVLVKRSSSYLITTDSTWSIRQKFTCT
jgi:hypothetical protein